MPRTLSLARTLPIAGVALVLVIVTEFALLVLLVATGRASSPVEGVAIVVGILGLAVGLALVAVSSSFVLELVVAPVNRLVATTRRFAEGDLHARAGDERTTELRELARELNAMAGTFALRRTQLESALDSTTDGLLIEALDGQVVLVNATLDAIWMSLGLTQDGPIRARLAALADLTSDPEQHLIAFDHVAVDPEAEFSDELSLPSQARAFIARTAPVRGNDGTLLGRILSLREVTRERESERLKDEFVATVSRELRTPLTSIQGFVELLLAGEGGALAPDQRRFLSVVDRNADQLLRLVGDLLLVAQLDAHTLRLHLEDVDVSDVAVEAVEAARPAAQEAGLRLELLLEDSPLVRADRARLGELLDNLVSNAIKFTPSGGLVEVATAQRADAAVVSVRDTGPGMSSEEVDALFGRFYRTEGAVRGQVPGLGLGLAISKAIAEAHGGTIDVRSARGSGTTFTLVLPTRPS